MADIQYSDIISFCIVGAGGLGRELESWISNDETFKSNHNLLGFLDSNSDAFKNVKFDYKIRRY